MLSDRRPILLTNARIVDPSRDLDIDGDLLIADGIVRDADWASSITSIAADRIRALARSLVEQRSLITASWSLQRADHGEHAIWTAIALAAAVGQIGLPGGGFGIGYGVQAHAGPWCSASYPSIRAWTVKIARSGARRSAGPSTWPRT